MVKALVVSMRDAAIFKHVFLASDHAGVALKKALLSFCAHHSVAWEDLGPFDETAVDYPDFARKVVDKVRAVPDSAGVLICGSGVGMSLAANRFPGIRAALCLDHGQTADLARRHNNANVLCLGANLVSQEAALVSLQTFLTTTFEGGRHERRLKKLEAQHL